MVAGIVPRLVLLDGFGEEVGTPVREAADDAAVGEDQGAGGVGYSSTGGEAVLVARVMGVGGRIGVGKGRFYSLTSLVVCGFPTRTWFD